MILWVIARMAAFVLAVVITLLAIFIFELNPLGAFLIGLASSVPLGLIADMVGQNENA